jgi:hypothetical protein
MLKGKFYSFTTVDGYDVTEDHSGKDSRGFQCTWYYFNGHFIDNRLVRGLSKTHRCYPHKFKSVEKQEGDRYRWTCDVCNHTTNNYDTYSRSERNYNKSLACAPTYPSSNPIDLPENAGKKWNSIAFIDSKSVQS